MRAARDPGRRASSDRTPLGSAVAATRERRLSGDALLRCQRDAYPRVRPIATPAGKGCSLRHTDGPPRRTPRDVRHPRRDARPAPTESECRQRFVATSSSPPSSRATLSSARWCGTDVACRSYRAQCRACRTGRRARLRRARLSRERSSEGRARRRRQLDLHQHRHERVLDDDRGQGLVRIGSGRPRTRSDHHRCAPLGPPAADRSAVHCHRATRASLVRPDCLPVHAARGVPLRLHPRVPDRRAPASRSTRSWALLYGVFAVKVLFVRDHHAYPSWVLPLAGGTLFALLGRSG